jgi:F-type H+-transporting ATPase subunit b
MLNINWSTLLLQILNFVVMVFVLWRFFFKPVIRILDERSKKVTSALDEADRKQSEAEGMRAEYEKKLSEAQEQMTAMKQRVQEDLALAKRQLLDETRQEITAMRGKAQNDIEEARRQAISQHRRELGRLVTTLSARMMRESAGDAFQRASIEQFIDHLATLPDEGYRQTMEDSGTDVVHVQVVSALDLDADSVARIQTQVQHMTSQPVEISHTTDPSLVAGATIRFGDTVIDGSVAGQLEHLKERYIAELEQDKA